MRSRGSVASLLVAVHLMVLSVLVAAPAAPEKNPTVYITKSGDLFHRSSCQYVRQSRQAIKRNEAVKKGYKPCKVCKP